MVSFDDSEVLEDFDKKLFKSLNLKFRGLKAYPVFRRYLPGMYPYSLNSEEAGFLLLALNQTMEMAERLKANPELLKPKLKGQILLRQAGDNEVWSEEWVFPLLMAEKKEIDLKPHLERMQKIKENINGRGGAMEIDFFYFPLIMEDEKKPYFPYGYMAIDSDSYFILDTNMFKRVDLSDIFPDKFLSMLEKMAYLPSEILVKKDEVYDIMKPFADFFNIPLQKVNSLPAINDAKKSMSQFFKKPKY